MIRTPRISSKQAAVENPSQIAKAYIDWHWGTPHLEMRRINDIRLPTHLVECGRLVQLEVETPDFTSPTGYKVHNLRIPKGDQENNHIAFDPDHPHQRLYIILDDKSRMNMRALFNDLPYALTPLKFWAKVAGGKHASGGYPDIVVKPVGLLMTAGYGTNKLPDGPSWYKHLMGEESGTRPMLTVSKDGMLWLAGGDYTSPTPGITN